MDLGLIQSRETVSSMVEGAPPVEAKAERCLEKRYGELATVREPYLREARELCQAVMPYLYPPDGIADSLDVDSANQSMLAKGVINLAKELADIIFPANAKFFSQKVAPQLAQSISLMSQQLDSPEDQLSIATEQSRINNKLVAIDELLRDTIKSTPDSENAFQALLHAIVSGTGCIAKPTLFESKVYTLEQFVAEFDSTGEPVEVIVKDKIHISKFSPETLKDLYGYSDELKFERANIREITVFTRQIRRFDHWEIQVEIGGKRYEPMEGQEELDSPPFIVFPFFWFSNHRMGISYLTHNKGDILQYENLSLTLNLLSEAAAKILAVLPPSMKNTQKDLESKTGMSFVFGEASTVQFLLADISKNQQAIQGFYTTVQQNLFQAFLLQDAIRRDAERVTREEILQMVKGLKQLLGGIFISCARRIQRPYISRTKRLAAKEGIIPTLPEGSSHIILTSGVETLEALDDLQALDQLTGRLFGLGPEFMQRLNTDEYASRLSNLLTVVKDGLILNDEQVQEKVGVSQIVEMAKQLGPQGPQMIAGAMGAVMQQAQQAATGTGTEQQGEPSELQPQQTQTA